MTKKTFKCHIDTGGVLTVTDVYTGNSDHFVALCMEATDLEGVEQCIAVYLSRKQTKRLHNVLTEQLEAVKHG